MDPKSDPSLDLELNLKFLSNDLCQMVDNSLNDLESPTFSSELSHSLDEYCRQIYPEADFPEFYPKNYKPKDQRTEDSGFLSASNNFSDYMPEVVSNFVPEQPKTSTFVPEMVPQMPSQVPQMTLPMIPSWHPTYGNVLIVPQIQANPYFTPIHIPMVPPSPLLMPQQANFVQSHHMNFTGRNFSKKYPRRSQKGFTVVPKKEPEKKFENLDDVVINLRELNIGPPELYESNQTKLMNNFTAALQFLSNLANECIEIESSILNALERSTNLDFTKDVTGYQFSHYLRCIVSHAKLEQINAKVVFKSLHAHFIDNCKGKKNGKFNINKMGSALVDELHRKTEAFNKLGTLNIMCDRVFDVNEQPEELSRITEATNDLIKAIRNVTICLWSLKVLFRNNEIKNFSMKVQ
ncbi:uncharacterized protein LOC134838147 [Culicoides brevitarsis]|uniref:uncharacterized protein LOC134838147 n=1 Tax=Culicoides brevitarsis TaxID=469753 RepID=UPI00307C5C7A